MNRLFYCVLIFCFIFTGCSSGNAKEDNRIVAHVNNYKMSVEDLRYELNNIAHDEKGLLETQIGRKEFMDRLLEKEILLQEAQRLGLDREKDFMKSIEGYWEQALLKLLLEKKSNKISGFIHVYDNEIEEYYRNSGERLPLSRVKTDIRRAIRQKKETEAMGVWIEELKKKSYIKIKEDIVREIFSDR